METGVIMWGIGVLGTLFCALVVYILRSINDSIKGVRDEVSLLNNNLVRIDRRVAYLEGRLSGHPDGQAHPRANVA